MFKGLIASKAKKQKIEGYVFVSNYLKLKYSKKMNDKILVCIQTDFVNMSLFTKFKAIITEQGGLLSHAAIYAREYKIPCIVGVKDITKKLKTGDKVKIDFEKGEIEIL